jgi:hypothetical protein
MQPMPGAGSWDPEAAMSNHVLGENINDLLKMPIEEADPVFLDSQEDFWHGSKDFAYKEESEDS